MTQDFKADLQFGEKYEKIFCSYLNTIGLKAEIVNQKGYDILTESGDTYEVKSDRYTKNNGNVAFEIVSNKKINTLGWVYYSDAKFLAYFISETEFFVAPMIKIKDFVNTAGGLFEEKHSIESNSISLIVPVKRLPSWFKKWSIE